MGLVLVFDLDQTIIDSSDEYLFNRPDTPEGIGQLKFKAKSLLNTNLVNNIIKRAARLRGKKDASGNDLVTGIFLLTNNSSKIMVSAVDSVLRDEIAIKNPVESIGRYMTPENFDPDTEGMPKQDYFFDSILMRDHKKRTQGSEEHSPLKNLDDVKRMLAYIGVILPEEQLRENTFFFDDMEHPGMRVLKPGNYIKIVPPFRKYQAEHTDYTPILRKLSELEGNPLPEQRKFGRNRSNTMNEGAGNNMELPPPAHEVTVRHTPGARGTLSSLFKTPSSSSGGAKPLRLRRTRKNRSNKSRKRLRK